MVNNFTGENFDDQIDSVLSLNQYPMLLQMHRAMTVNKVIDTDTIECDAVPDRGSSNFSKFISVMRPSSFG